MMGEKMSVYELCKFVSDRSDDYRVYNWREVEAMRESVIDIKQAYAKTAKMLGSFRVKILHVEGVMNELRSAGLYEWSDKLRDALKGDV